MRRIIFSLVLLMAGLSVYAWKPLMMGHRGGNTGVMNTAEAYRNGVSVYGFDGLECDVRVTSDGQYVISHDPTTKAVGGNLTVESSTLAQLQAETYTQTRNGITYTGKICTVDEYLQICEDSAVTPVIELKWTTGINTGDMTNFDGLYTLIANHNLENKAIILTSMMQSLIYVHRNYPSLKCQYLLQDANITETYFNNCINYGLEPSVEFAKLTPCWVKRFHDAGVNVATFTVDWASWYDKLCEMGVYMITTDLLHPDQMKDNEPVEWEYLCEEVLDSIPVYVDEKFAYTQKDGTLPADFPTGSRKAQQGFYLDGVFYANDYTSGTVYAFDTLGNAVGNTFPATSQRGFCRDDAGNIVIDDSQMATTPSRMLLFSSPAANPDTLTFSLPMSGQANYPTASGDLYSEDGGYIYFYPSGQSVVNILHVANGKVQSVDTTTALTVAASTVGYVLPYDNDPTFFFYQMRTSGYYRYKLKDRGDFYAGDASTTAPERNMSVGGAIFSLDDHKMLIYPSGTDYTGGWSLKDMSAGKRDIFTREPMGEYASTKAASAANSSCGAFFTVERVDEHTVMVYEYCLGNGIAGWRISTQEPVPEALDSPENSSHAEKIMKDGILLIRRNGVLYTIFGAVFVD